MVKAADLTGQTFSRLIVIERSGSQRSKALWRCSCSCGAETFVTTDRLVGGTTKSCGCLKLETRMGRLQHGRTRSREWRSWVSIRRRCFDPSYPGFRRYSALGMAEEWKADFAAFFEHIGPAPIGANVTVDRIDNAKGYFPGNVRWASKTQQARNTKRNVYVQYNGKRMLLVEACAMAGVDYYVAYSRLKRGTNPFR